MVTARLALVAVPTIVVTLAELLARLGSLVPEVTEATSVICVWLVVPALTCTTRVNEAFAPLATNGFVQLIFPVAPTAGVVHVHPAGADKDWKVVLAGMASLKTALIAAIGPLFVTPCV